MTAAIPTQSVVSQYLPQYSLLRFSGADAQSFLQGQLTCDVAALQPGNSTYGGYCTPKGRLLATFLLWSAGGTYTMLLPSVLAEPIRKRLMMYVLRAKVKVEDITADHACVGVHGADAAQGLAAAPDRLHGVVERDGVTVISLPVARYLTVMPRTQANLADGNDAWSGLDIAAGIPFITPATQEEFVPQMVNLDLIGGLSYSKGCYPGQEIVARTHYLGRLKQRMYRASVAALAVPGDKLYCAELGDQSAGMVVTVAPATDGRHEVLAVMQTAHALSAPYHLGSLQGPLLELLPLPYKTG
ncbi:MAG: YgfZ/GcvT domain-containing protein [Betaproteobacteria bacterium]